MKNKHLLFVVITCLIQCPLLHAQYWSELGGLNSLKANYGINTVCSDPSGNIYAAGLFNNGSRLYVAKWNGSIWSELGGFNGLAAFAEIKSICSDANGNIYAGGDFKNSLGNYYIAKWNGINWSELGGVNSTFVGYGHNVSSICSDLNGNIYAATGPIVQKWNGTSWSILGGAFQQNGATQIVLSICSDTFGNIYAAGTLKNALGKCCVAKWNGSSWIEYGGVNNVIPNNVTSPENYNIIRSICCDASGNVWAAGSFVNTSGSYYVSKINGNGCLNLGGPFGTLQASYGIQAICNDSNGNLYAGGTFTNSAGKHFVAKFDGNIWNELDAPNGMNAQFSGNIRCISKDATGNIYAGGYFANFLGKYFVAKYNATVGIEELANAKKLFNIYPSPTQSKINVKADVKLIGSNYIVYDNLGKSVLIGQINSENTSVELSNLPSGIYTINIGDNLKQSFKVIKE